LVEQQSNEGTKFCRLVAWFLGCSKEFQPAFILAWVERATCPLRQERGRLARVFPGHHLLAGGPPALLCHPTAGAARRSGRSTLRKSFRFPDNCNLVPSVRKPVDNADRFVRRVCKHVPAVRMYVGVARKQFPDVRKLADQADKQFHLVRLLVCAIRIQFHSTDKPAGSVRKAANLTDNLEDWKYDLENPVFNLVHTIRMSENPMKLKDLSQNTLPTGFYPGSRQENLFPWTRYLTNPLPQNCTRIKL
jgi:hypothetical protein